MKASKSSKAKPQASEAQTEFDNEDLTVIQEGATKRVVTYISTFKGTKLFNIRKQYLKDGEWAFTKDGIAITMGEDDRKTLVKLSKSVRAAADSLFGD